MLNTNLDVKGLLGQMGVNADKQLDLPVAGTGSGGGFVAPILGMLLYGFSAEVDLEEHNTDADENQQITPKFAVKFGDSGWCKMYWEATPDGFEAAEKARKLLGAPYRPGMVWYVMCEVEKVINLTDDKKANFVRPEISAEARVMTLASKKYRHEWHEIALPKAVSAIAELYRKDLGIDDEVDLSFDISELRRLEEEVTDEQYEQLCGDPDERNGHLTGLLWQRREKLWAALGEPDASKYMPIGKGKHATESPALSLCLSFLSSEWSGTVWGRFAWIPDPRPDAYRETDDATYRDQLPGLIKLYRNEDEARADVQVDEEAKSEGATDLGNGYGATKTTPALGGDWAGMEDEFAVELHKHDGKPAIIAAKKLAGTETEVVEWRAHLGIAD